MREYRLITSDSEVVKRLMKKPMRGFGWEIRVETNESGEIWEDEALLLTPEGVHLARPRLSDPKVFNEIKELVQSDAELAMVIEDLERPPLICVRQMPTGGVLATLWLSGQEMVPSPGEYGADDSRAITRGPEAFDELAQAIIDWRAAHPNAQVDSEIPLADLVDDAPAPIPQPQDESHVPPSEALQEVAIADIGHFPGGNVREQFQGLDELAQTIRKHGIIQPLTVNLIDGRYTLMAGERRLRAAGLAGLATVPCRVMRVTEQQALEIMLVENIQRQDLNPVEEARAYQRLIDMPGATQGSVAERVGKHREYVNEMLQLLDLPTDLADLVARGELSKRVGLEYIRQTRDLPAGVKNRVAVGVAIRRPTAREIRFVLQDLLTQEGVARTTPTVKPAPPVVAPAPSAPTFAVTDPAAPPAQLADEPQITERPSGLPRGVSTDTGRPLPYVARIWIDGRHCYLGSYATPEEAHQAYIRAENEHMPALSTSEDSPPASASAPEPVTPKSVAASEASAPVPDSRDPQAERAHSLAEIGRRFWDTTSNDPWAQYNFGRYQDVMFARECYLPLERVLRHWGLRQEIGANSIPKTMGSECRINIPEQKIWIKGYEQFSAATEIQLEGERLLIRLPTGGVEVAYSGMPVYYRIELSKQDQGGNKALEQQLVIQDGDRHIVITGGGSALIKKDLVPLLADLVNELPGLPEGVDPHVGDDSEPEP